VIEEREESLQNCQSLACMDGIYLRNPSKFGLCNFPASYHNGACGLNFADGHSEIHKWRDPRTTPPRGQGEAHGLDDPLPSPYNEDAYWLGVRTTGPK
jgi:prepilin-type processing-associated H-X9-DG protein